MESRNSEFPYNHKTVALGKATFMWMDAHTLIIFLPKDLIEIKNLFVYLEIDFGRYRNLLGQMVDNTTPDNLRKIGWIGSPSGRKVFNAIAEDDVASVKYDFSSELGIFGLVDGRPAEINGAKSLRIDFGCGNNLGNQNLGGNIRIWKVDIVYTTREIR